MQVDDQSVTLQGQDGLQETRVSDRNLWSLIKLRLDCNYFPIPVTYILVQPNRYHFLLELA